MTLKWALVFLLALNGVMLLSNWALTWTLKSFSSGDRKAELEALKAQRNGLAGERARLEAKIGILSDTVRRLEEAAGRLSSQKENPVPLKDPGKRSEFQDDGFDARVLEELEGEKPDPSRIPILAREELEALEAYSSKCPRLDDRVLIEGDAESVLVDPGWNPRGLELDMKGKAELRMLLHQYRYFARISPIESLRKMVLPEIPRLREAGAFVEYGVEEAPPRVEGVDLTHAEPSDKPPEAVLFLSRRLSGSVPPREGFA